jgi:hypothetical protein
MIRGEDVVVEITTFFLSKKDAFITQKAITPSLYITKMHTAVLKVSKFQKK